MEIDGWVYASVNIDKAIDEYIKKQESLSDNDKQALIDLIDNYGNDYDMHRIIEMSSIEENEILVPIFLNKVSAYTNKVTSLILEYPNKISYKQYMACVDKMCEGVQRDGTMYQAQLCRILFDDDSHKATKMPTEAFNKLKEAFLYCEPFYITTFFEKTGAYIYRSADSDYRMKCIQILVNNEALLLKVLLYDALRFNDIELDFIFNTIINKKYIYSIDIILDNINRLEEQSIFFGIINEDIIEKMESIVLVHKLTE